ncbi:efflux RND transporter periplasmic adaptor subunit [Ferrimonas aestuarii]|uniref:HlyD family efflux transporter periplasmic adaptor subunit n=1 Tax=Ferrimonas aestuarii TaxID=2569539 RepID=A0A4U1BST5_9GAMM|nr:HlyD family efflux transporter periplasmic adaptor subunit [Ferrimonas aestuarii]TKB55335.1 HlyD family efflux transporter periplasmic adaptor subunit [Ferrimonas aestuarii]
MRNSARSWVYGGLSIASAVMLASGWLMGFADPVQVVSAQGVVIEKVRSGDFALTVEGYGTLQSVNRRLITATSTAIVDEIRLKAGAPVEPDTVILTLKNPELEGQLRQALAFLKSAKTSKRQLNLQQQRELLNSESQFAELKAEAEIAQLQMEAERSLVESGVISGISAKRNQLKAAQLRQRVELEKAKLQKLQQVHQETLSIQDELIAQAEDNYQQVKHQVDQLSVKAGISGVIQQLPVTLGESVVPGTRIATVGSLFPLVAEIKVPQLQANLLMSGQQAEITALDQSVYGQVVRIDPVVSEGAVQVDILLDGETKLKPMQMVDALIQAKVDPNVRFIHAPAGIQQNSKQQLFKVAEDNSGVRVEVNFGKRSGDLIQVIAGVSPGERLITSQIDVDESISRIQLKL